MDLATEVATSQVVWAVLCILLAAAVIREMRKENVKRENDLINLYEQSRGEAHNREQQLMTQLKTYNESQNKIVDTLDQIQGSLSDLRQEVQVLEKRIEKRR